MGISAIDAAGFEGDDLIATIAEKAEQAGEDLLIVTGDRDTYQLVRDPHIRVLYNKRGVSDYALYDEAGIFERTGVTGSRPEPVPPPSCSTFCVYKALRDLTTSPH